MGGRIREQQQPGGADGVGSEHDDLGFLEMLDAVHVDPGGTAHQSGGVRL